LQGLEAISAANGWAMAYTGAAIVAAGLTILALIISQLHKVIAFFEKQEPDGTDPTKTLPGTEELIESMVSDLDLMNLEDAAAVYQTLAEQLQQPFKLEELYGLTQQHRLPHPHLTIKSFREAGKLVFQGDGLFTWAPLGAPEEPVVSPAPVVPAVVHKAPAAVSVATPAAPVVEPAPETPAIPPESSALSPEPAAAGSGTAMTAPMPGMIVRYEKQAGDAVSEGETVVIPEAMIMENALPAPVSGTIKSINFASGDAVKKEDVLCIVD